jgi:hypothetical protein
MKSSTEGQVLKREGRRKGGKGREEGRKGRREGEKEGGKDKLFLVCWILNTIGTVLVCCRLLATCLCASRAISHLWALLFCLSGTKSQQS